MGIFSNKSKYYNYLQTAIKNEYDKNYSSKYNKIYGLRRNRFVQTKKVRKHIKGDSKYLFKWKSYLLNKLETDDETSWKYSLYNSISNDNGYNKEYFYQNVMFFNEYSILNAPKQIFKNFILDSKTEPILSPFDNDELKNYSEYDDYFSINNEENNKSRKSQIIIDKNDKKEQISCHITVTKINESVDYTSQSRRNDDFDDNQHNISKIKKYIPIILRELKDDSHPITCIIKEFVKYFIPYLNNKLKKVSDKFDIFKKQIVKEIQFFIEIMQVALKLFYIKSINYKFFVSERDEFINLICYILFNYKKQNRYVFYNAIFEFFHYLNKEETEKFEEKIESLGSLSPREAGINIKFCLEKEIESNNEQEEQKPKSKITEFFEKNAVNFNNQTDQEIENNLSDDDDDEDEKINIDKQIFKEDKFHKTFKSGFTNNSELNNDNAQEDIIINSYDEFKNRYNSLKENKNKLIQKIDENFEFFSTKETTPSTRETKNSHNNNSDDIPYINAIKYIRRIKDYKTPLEKLTIIAFTNIEITKSIDEYYKDKKDISKGFLNIDADELMSIYLYIFFNMRLPSILTELDFIKYFTTKITKKSMIGYYYTTLYGCYEFLMKAFSKEDLTKNSV